MNEFGVVSNLPHAIGIIEVKVSGVDDSTISLPGDDRGAPTLKLVERINQNGFGNRNLWIVEHFYHALDLGVLLGLAEPPEPGDTVEQGVHSLRYLLHVELKSRDDALSKMSDWLLESFFRGSVKIDRKRWKIWNSTKGDWLKRWLWRCNEVVVIGPSCLGKTKKQTESCSQHI